MVGWIWVLKWTSAGRKVCNCKRFVDVVFSGGLPWDISID